MPPTKALEEGWGTKGTSSRAINCYVEASSIWFAFDDRFQAIQHLLRQFLIYLMNGVTRMADYIVTDNCIVIYQVEAGFPPRTADIDNSEFIFIYRNYFSGESETHFLFSLLFHNISFFNISDHKIRIYAIKRDDVMHFFLEESIWTCILHVKLIYLSSNNRCACTNDEAPER